MQAARLITGGIFRWLDAMTQCPTPMKKPPRKQQYAWGASDAFLALELRGLIR
jgi:hypothetical protein